MKFTKTFSRSRGAGIFPALGSDAVPTLSTDVDLGNGAYLRFGHDDTEISHSFAIICTAPAGSDPIPCDLYFWDELTTAWYLCDTENLTPGLLDWMDVAMLQPQPVAPPGVQIGADLACGGYYVRPRMTLGGNYPDGTYMFAFGLDAQAAMSDIDAAIILIANATHLEDTPHITGDRGMFDLAVRNDLAQTVLTNLNGDYSGFAVNDRGETLSRDVDIIVLGVPLVAPGNTTAITCTSGINTVGVLATANSTVAAVFEGTRDGATWEAVYGIDRISNLRVLGFAAGVNGSWAIPSAGYQQIRVRATTIGAGPTVTVALEGSAKPIISMPTPTADTSSIGVVTVAMGAGSVAVDTNGSSTCSIRVTGPIIGWGGASVTFERFDPDLAMWEQAIGYPPDGGLGALTATADGVWLVPCAGFSQVRGRAAGVGGAGGPITISLESSTGVQLVTQLNDHHIVGTITAVMGFGDVEVNTNGYSTCMIQTMAINGGVWGTAEIFFERYDPDLATWASAIGYPMGGGLGLPSVTVDGEWIVPCAGFSRVRARAANVDSDTIALSLESSPGIQITTPPGDHRVTDVVLGTAVGSVEIVTNGYSTCTIQVACTGWGTGIVYFERYDPDLATWAAAIGYPPDGGLGLPSTTANGIWIVPCAGFSRVRARVDGATVNNVELSLESSPGIQIATPPGDHRTTGTVAGGAIGSVEINTNGYSTCTIQAACAAWNTGVLLFERYDPDLATWAAALGYPPDGGAGVPSITANGVWIVPCAGFSRVRARVTGATTNDMVLSLESSPGIRMLLGGDGDIIVPGVILDAVGENTAITCTSGINTVGVLATLNNNVTAIFEATRDGATWEAVYGIDRVSGMRVLGFGPSVNGSWAIPCAGYQQVRVWVTAIGGAPTVTVALEGSTRPMVIMPEPTADDPITGTITTAGNTVAIPCAGRDIVGVKVAANTTITAIFEATRDGTNWEAVFCSLSNAGTSADGFAANENGLWHFPCAGWQQFRVRCTVDGGGGSTATVTLLATVAGNFFEQPGLWLYNYGTDRGDGTSVWASATTITFTTIYTVDLKQLRKIVVDTGTEERVYEQGHNGVRFSMAGASPNYVITIAGAGVAPLPAGSTVDVFWDGPDKAIYREDAAAVSGDYGVASLRVRRDVPVSSGSADGDYVWGLQDADGYDYVRDKAYDSASNANRVAEIAQVWSRNVLTPINVIGAAQNIAVAWADLGPEISCQGYKTFCLHVDVDINTCVNVRFRALALTSAGGAKEFPLPIKVVDSTGAVWLVKVQPHVYELDLDVDQKALLDWVTENAISTIQFQVSCEAMPGAAGQVLSAELTYGY